MDHQSAASPRLLSIAARTTPEADLRALAAAKVQANKAYEAVLYAPKAGLSEEQLIDREVALAMASKAFFQASEALARAV